MADNDFESIHSNSNSSNSFDVDFNRYATERLARLGAGEDFPDKAADGELKAWVDFLKGEDLFGFHHVGDKLSNPTVGGVIFQVIGALNNLTGHLQQSAIVSAKLANLRKSAEKRFVDEVALSTSKIHTDLYNVASFNNEKKDTAALLNNQKLNTRISDLRSYQKLYSGDASQLESYASSALNSTKDYFKQISQNLQSLTEIISAIYKI